MSLINKVLRDLETRERDEQTSQSRPVLADLRAARESPERSRIAPAKWLVLVGVITAIGAVVAWYASGGPRTAPAPVIAKASVAPSKRAPLSQAAVAPPHARAPRAASSAQARPKPTRPGVFVSSARPPVTPHRVAPPARHASASISRQRKPLTAAEQAMAAYRHAVQALQAGDAGRARIALRAALRARPASLAPALLLATLDIQGAHLRGARQVLQAALRARPHALQAIMLLAQVDLRRGRPEDAARTLGRAQVFGAASHSYWALLAASRLRAGDRVGALSAYRSGLRRFPRDGSLWVGEGLVESQMGHVNRARLAWRKALHCPLSPVLARFVQAEVQGNGVRQKR